MIELNLDNKSIKGICRAGDIKKYGGLVEASIKDDRQPI